MTLNFREYGSGQALIILHGLFGSSDNWQSLGKKLAAHYHVFLIDQRNHGHSPWSDQFSYDLMASDLFEFVNSHGLQDILLVGHSMGGKTAMHFCAQHSALVEKLVVVDIAPKAYPPHHDQIFEALMSLDFNKLSSRSEAEVQLSYFIEDPAVKQFLLKNLYWKSKEQLALRMNVAVLHREMREILKDLQLPVLFNDTLFIRGGKSNYIVEEDYAEIEHLFPNGQIVSIADAGHWVHAEAAQQFERILLSFFFD